MKLQWDELSGARDPKHCKVVGSTETLAQFPPVQDQVEQTIAIAYDIRAVQRGEITDTRRRMSGYGNALSPIIRAITAELMKCCEAYTKQRIDAAKRGIEQEAFERGVQEGMRQQQELDAATVDGVIYVSELE